MLQYMWSQTDIKLGIIKEGSVHQMEYKLLVDGFVDPKFISIPCGCTSALWNEQDKVLKVSYTAKPVPINFIALGKTSYDVYMPIEVPVRIDGGFQKFNLTFTATVQQ